MARFTPRYEGDFPSLGWQVIDWLEESFKVPDGKLAGQPFTLTDEQATLLVRWYALDARNRLVFRRGAVRGAKGKGKSPLLAGIALAELCGPVVFDGYDANGEPVGMPHGSPLVQIAAVSEDQASNVFSWIYAMAFDSPLNGSVLDVGMTRLNRTDGFGRCEPVTAAAGTREGQRLTFAVLDESALWTRRNGGVKLANTIRRNASKMAGRTFEATNAFLRGEDSVAEATWRANEDGAPGLLYDAVEGTWVEDLADRDAVMASLKIAYGESAAWVDLERLADEIADPATEPDDARRFYLNQVTSGGNCPIDIAVWDSLARTAKLAEPGAYIGLGFDGSVSQDTTCLYGCTPDGYVFELAIWARPPDAPRDWTVPRREVHDTLREVFAYYDVGLMLADPAKWQSEIEDWARLYSTDDNPRVAALDTNKAYRFAPVCDRFATAVRERAITHDGKERLRLSLAATKKKLVRLSDDADDGRSAFVIVKADTRKIDEAVAAHLAYTAALTMPEQPRAKRFRIISLQD